MRHDDPGLQPERTSLAWMRTGAALGAVVLAFMRFTPGPGPVVAAVGLVCLTPAVIVLLSARFRHRARVRDFVAGEVDYLWWRNILVAASVVVLAITAAVLIAVSGAA
ncbi:DUF202 domain-containing protein [Rhodococcus coprophilus]|uniref:Predicted membrane protein n=1 Tax=Rhodococcus coprophilus TaxID=38310 RepID=A0A2X4US99_9NOCA|nr:DUF202 domain-containing protein [Rhodococcus coprophilus]MBM7459848.1 uncharacterized membrane protein YidH (DUF202 family) [Rhodococcus coprophilus]SQI37512.1 Predicted membrane protein [Rhodococcus coprophilus]